jgi:hypothetical protein
VFGIILLPLRRQRRENLVVGREVAGFAVPMGVEDPTAALDDE